MNDGSFLKIEEHLFKNADSGQESIPADAREAAVLIPLMPGDAGWELLFIVRSTRDDDHHSGQVAFPGGAREPDDLSSEYTALRETQEEIGLHPSNVSVIGSLAPYLTSSHFAVTPIVGIVPIDPALTLSRDEVARTFTIPLTWLSNFDNLEIRPYRNGRRPVIYYHHYKNEVLWGATARMTLNFIKALELGAVSLPGLSTPGR